MCDYQPNALLSARERARNEGFEQTVERLRRDEDRLDVLRYGSRDVAAHIAGEYNNLEPIEKQAFLLLTVPEAETFVPWVLQPLLQIGSVQAGNLMASIARVGLLELEGRDPSGFGRYRFCSLARLFAIQQLQSGSEVSGSELDEARVRFRRAYLAGAIKVLGQLGVTDLPNVPFNIPGHWYPQVERWEERVANNLDPWIRKEFGNLIRVVLEANRNRQYAACWQVASRLGDCFSRPALHVDVLGAFDSAITASHDFCASTPGEIKVRLAKSGYLATIGDFSGAISELTITVDIARKARELEVAAEALRRLGHAWQEIGGYDQALPILHDGNSIANGKGPESRLFRVLLAENEAMREPDLWASQPSLDGLPVDRRSNSQFIEKVTLGRAAVRRRSPTACTSLLAEARLCSDGDLSHAFYISQEEITALLHSAPALKNSSPQNSNLDSNVLQAAQALCYANRLGQPYLQARARCSLADILIHSGRTQDCLRQLAIVKQIIELLPSGESLYLAVRMQRIRGQALLRLNQPSDALSELAPAERWLSKREPWAHAQILLLVGTAHRELRQFLPAIAAHSRAVEIFLQLQDTNAADNALRQFCATLRAAGSGSYSAHRIRHAIT